MTKLHILYVNGFDELNRDTRKQKSQLDELAFAIWWRGTDSNHRRRSRQIYSLLPLATREPLQGFSYSLTE